MQACKADLHIHTQLSPCASLDMSPVRIVEEALLKGLKIIGITDHNSTLQCGVVKMMGEEKGLFVMQGVEVTSREEVHQLAFFEKDDSLRQFQEYIERHQPKIKNNPARMGYQVVVDEFENITHEVENYLGMALDVGFDEVEAKVHTLGGIYIPAHINRSRFSMISQMGFVPEDIHADALEVFNRGSLAEVTERFPYLKRFALLKNSDSHYPEAIGSFFNTFLLEEISFDCIRKALSGKDGNSVYTS